MDTALGWGKGKMVVGGQRELAIKDFVVTTDKI